MLDRFAMNLD